MRFVALILGVLCFAASFLVFTSAQSAIHETLAGVAAIAGVLWFVLVGVLEVKASVDKLVKAAGQGGPVVNTDKLAEEVEQLRLHVEMVRKIKEAEWRERHPPK